MPEVRGLIYVPWLRKQRVAILKSLVLSWKYLVPSCPYTWKRVSQPLAQSSVCIEPRTHGMYHRSHTTPPTHRALPSAVVASWYLPSCVRHFPARRKSAGDPPSLAFEQHSCPCVRPHDPQQGYCEVLFASVSLVVVVVWYCNMIGTKCNEVRGSDFNVQQPRERKPRQVDMYNRYAR